MKKRLFGNSKIMLVLGMTAILSANLCTNYIVANAADVNYSTNTEDMTAKEDSGVYAYKMDDNYRMYCSINLEQQCVYLFTDDTEDDSCYKMNIIENTADSINAVLATDDITMPVSI